MKVLLPVREKATLHSGFHGKNQTVRKQVSGLKKKLVISYFGDFFSSFFEKTFMFKLGIHSNFSIYIFDNS